MLKDLLEGRRSISQFIDKPVHPETIDEIIDLSRNAPSSCNTQPWFFLVFNTSGEKDRLNEYIQKGYEHTKKDFEKKLFGPLYNKILTSFSRYGRFDKAPVYVLLFARPYDTPILSHVMKFIRDEKIQRIGEESVTTSAAMAMQNFLLVAHDKGLGTRVKDGIKFLMNFESLKDEFYDEFKIPDNYKLISGIQLGYPTADALKRKRPKQLPLDDIRRYV